MRHETGLKFQFCEPLASASGLHARDVKTKNLEAQQLFPKTSAPGKRKLSALCGVCGYKHFRQKHTTLISIVQELRFRQAIYYDPD